MAFVVQPVAATLATSRSRGDNRSNPTIPPMAMCDRIAKGPSVDEEADCTASRSPDGRQWQNVCLLSRVRAVPQSGHTIAVKRARRSVSFHCHDVAPAGFRDIVDLIVTDPDDQQLVHGPHERRGREIEIQASAAPAAFGEGFAEEPSIGTEHLPTL